MKAKNLAAAVCAAALFTFPIASVSLAQHVSDYPQRHGGATPDNPRAANNPDAVNDQTLARSAAAYVKIQHMSANGNLSDADRNAAIRESGMKPVAYKHVMNIVENDETLRHKFMAYVEKDGGHVPPPASHQ
jgi:hypothetical protein